MQVFAVRTHPHSIKNPGPHPVVAVCISKSVSNPDQTVATVAVTSKKDRFSWKTARKILAGRFIKGVSVEVTPNDNIQDIVKLVHPQTAFRTDLDWSKAQHIMESAIKDLDQVPA